MPPLLEYTHFGYRSHKLDLSPDEVVAVERIFAMARFISNHFFTMLDRLKLEKLQSLDLSYAAFKATAEALLMSDSYELFHDIHPAFLDAALYIVSDDWQRYLTRRGPRPVFKQSRDEQCEWLFDNRVLYVFQEHFSFPGSNVLLSIGPPKVRLSGKPVVYQLRRQKNNQYYLAVLYERAVKNPPITDDPMIIRLGVLLQKTLSTQSSLPLDLEKDFTHALEPCLIRKYVLTRFLQPKELPEDTRSTFDS